MTRLALAAVLLLAGCSLLPQETIVQQPTTALPLPQYDTPSNGAIYHAGYNYRPLFEDRRARNVGDTLTIVIAENTSVNKKGSSSAERTSSLGIDVPIIAKLPGKNFMGMEATAETSNKFDGKGESATSNNFSGTITATVKQVLPNGNLVVAGEKQVAFPSGVEYIRVSGVVTPRTLDRQNAVLSTQVADARIEYKARGYIDEAQIMGWLARFFLTVLPF